MSNRRRASPDASLSDVTDIAYQFTIMAGGSRSRPRCAAQRRDTSSPTVINPSHARISDSLRYLSDRHYCGSIDRDHCARAMSAKRSSRTGLIRLPKLPRATPLAQHEADKKQIRFRRGERAEFRRLQKRAKKAGLLVNRSSYELYFRDDHAEP
jgi:hypothetical protein